MAKKHTPRGGSANSAEEAAVKWLMSVRGSIDALLDTVEETLAEVKEGGQLAGVFDRRALEQLSQALGDAFGAATIAVRANPFGVSIPTPGELLRQD